MDCVTCGPCLSLTGGNMNETVFTFGGDAPHTNARQKDKTITGGKGANLAEMASIGLPVPPGFTIATEECLKYLAGGSDFSSKLHEDVSEALKHVERTVGKGFGDAADPLLVSVRSGAAVSMPGMMDTVLNLGLNDETVEGLAKISADERFAWDSYRRFIQMYGDVCSASTTACSRKRSKSPRKTRAIMPIPS